MMDFSVVKSSLGTRAVTHCRGGGPADGVGLGVRCLVVSRAGTHGGQWTVRPVTYWHRRHPRGCSFSVTPGQDPLELILSADSPGKWVFNRRCSSFLELFKAYSSYFKLVPEMLTAQGLLVLSPSQVSSSVPVSMWCSRQPFGDVQGRSPTAEVRFWAEHAVQLSLYGVWSCIGIESGKTWQTI